MLNFGKIKVTQNTPIKKYKNMTLYVVDSYFGIDIKTRDEIDKKEDEIIGKITVSHPEIMWGSHSEVLSDIKKICIQKLKDDNVLKKNQYGYLRLA